MKDNHLYPKTQWHRRGRVPHFEAGEAPQFITFRLADSLPRAVLGAKIDGSPDAERQRVEAALDASHGASFLTEPTAARIVQDALLHFDGDRYRLHAWCVMPNHAHVLVTPREGQALSELAHAWKGFAAHAINAARGTTGRVWADRVFRPPDPRRSPLRDLQKLHRVQSREGRPLRRSSGLAVFKRAREGEGAIGGPRRPPSGASCIVADYARK